MHPALLGTRGWVSALILIKSCKVLGHHGGQILQESEFGFGFWDPENVIGSNRHMGNECQAGL